MIATLRWAAPAALLACALGCGQDAPATRNAPAPGTTPGSSDATPALASANLVTLKVEGMV